MTESTEPVVLESDEPIRIKRTSRTLSRRYHELMDAELAAVEVANDDVISMPTIEARVAATLVAEGWATEMSNGYVKGKRHSYVTTKGLQTIQEDGVQRLFKDPDALLSLGESEVARLGDAVEHKNLLALNRAQGIYYEELKKVQTVTAKLDGLREIIGEILAQREVTWDKKADDER